MTAVNTVGNIYIRFAKCIYLDVENLVDAWRYALLLSRRIMSEVFDAA